MHWNLKLFGNKVIGRFSLTSHTQHPNNYFAFTSLFLHIKEN